ncbi:MAG: Helix-turn-helix domain protein [bacterium ADurb.Bin400]|nr:MAG: Helix-turn-helix domain protein [bacterium ADurb.Bin400]
MTKKGRLRETLGERFKRARQENELSLLDVEAGTKVRAKYLVALENDDWDALPQKVYTRGFVLAYARYLQLDTDEILKLFEQGTAYLGSGDPDNLVYKRSVKESRVLITPKLIAYLTFGMFVVSMFSYIVYQVAGFAGSPNLKITTPENNLVVEEDSLDLAGVTDTDTYVTVNDENIPVTSEGRFSLSYKLHRGVNVINIRAINKAKKESVQVYTVEYRPKTAAAEERRGGDSSF